jgi:cell shape-determining protein MreC
MTFNFDEKTLSAVSTVVLTIVTLIGLLLNYRRFINEILKKQADDKAADRSTLREDYDRRNALLKEREEESKIHEAKIEILEKENSELRQENSELRLRLALAENKGK